MNTPRPKSKPAGAVDEEMFMNSFENVPRVQISSVNDLKSGLCGIKEVCNNPNIDWEKRVDCLRKFRSFLLAGAADYDEFYELLKSLEMPFKASVKDLRSQVVREACISIAYLSQTIENRCDRFAEALLPSLITLIPNCVKIMSSSAVIAIRFIIQRTHADRLIPIIHLNISSKSKDIRKACCEFLDLMLCTWSYQTLEKRVVILQEAIKKGINDADPEARAHSRKAFWSFSKKFKLQSYHLLTTLDAAKQKLLQGEEMNNWSLIDTLKKTPQSNNKPQVKTPNSTKGSAKSSNRPLKGSAPFTSKPWHASSYNIQKSYKKPGYFLSNPTIDEASNQIDEIENAPPKLMNDAISSNVIKTPTKFATPLQNNYQQNLVNDNPIYINPLFDGNYSRSNLISLIQFVQESPTLNPAEFIDIYKALLAKYYSFETNTKHKVLILEAVGQILRKSPFEEFMSQTLIMLLKASKDPDRAVVKAAEEASNFAVSSYDSYSFFKLLRSRMLLYIKSTETPRLSVPAIKMLTKMVRINKNKVHEFLPEMMPILVEAFNHAESEIRKESHFCMVEIFRVVGESMYFHLNSLSTAKMKLLRLYTNPPAGN